MNEFTRPMAHPAMPTPARDPEDKNAPCPRRYTRVSCPRVYLLFLAFAARVFRTEAERGLAVLFFLVDFLFAVFRLAGLFRFTDRLFRTAIRILLHKLHKFTPCSKSCDFSAFYSF